MEIKVTIDGASLNNNKNNHILFDISNQSSLHSFLTIILYLFDFWSIGFLLLECQKSTISPITWTTLLKAYLNCSKQWQSTFTGSIFIVDPLHSQIRKATLRTSRELTWMSNRKKTMRISRLVVEQKCLVSDWSTLPSDVTWSLGTPSSLSLIENSQIWICIHLIFHDSFLLPFRSYRYGGQCRLVVVD